MSEWGPWPQSLQLALELGYSHASWPPDDSCGGVQAMFSRALGLVSLLVVWIPGLILCLPK